MSEGSSFSSIQAGGKKAKGKDEGLWLLAFSDLCCILISFFVLLLSYSKIDNNHYDNVKEGMKEEKHEQKTEKQEQSQQTLKKLSTELTESIKELKLDDKTEVVYDLDGVAIEFKDPLLFKSGSAKSDPKYEEITKSIISLIAKNTKTYKLTFEGHTDDRPVAGGPYKNNWELSGSRGVALLERFKAKGVPEERMSIVSYAHTKPRVPFVGLKGRKLEEARDSNRRAVIRIHY